MIHLIDPDQPLRQLKHVVPQRDDDELCVLGALFDVGRHDGYLFIPVSIHLNLRVKSAKLGLIELTFRKSNAASISSMTYSGVGR